MGLYEVVMNKKAEVILLIALSMISFSSNATMTTCPDPLNSSLKEGKPPELWEINPFSAYSPTVDEHTRFAKAEILVAGIKILGVVCYYKSQEIIYSIWRSATVSRPTGDKNWGDSLSGYSCTNSLQDCQFNVLDISN